MRGSDRQFCPCLPVILGERNYVLNPAHSDFARIEFAQPETFRFDLRLISREPPLTDKEARRELVELDSDLISAVSQGAPTISIAADVSAPNPSEDFLRMKISV